MLRNPQSNFWHYVEKIEAQAKMIFLEKNVYSLYLWSFVILFVIQKFWQIIRFFYNRSSRTKMFCKKVVLQNFGKFTGKSLCRSHFFDLKKHRPQLYEKRNFDTGVFL